MQVLCSFSNQGGIWRSEQTSPGPSMNMPAHAKTVARLELRNVSSSAFVNALVIATAVASLLVYAPCALAQSQAQGPSAMPSPGQIKPPANVKPVPSNAPASQKSEASPTWRELTPAQQASLKPLAANWSGIGEAQKRKWLAVSKNYPSLPAPEQAKLHSRMTEWASLSQQQRTQARLNFAETKKLSSDEKTANWQAYQALSPEDRQKLAATATPKPAGAAAAVKPVAPQKLAAVPLTRQDSKGAGAGVPGTPGGQAVDRNTLLPRQSFAADPAARKN